MRNKADREIIERFLRVCIREEWNQEQAAQAVGLSQGWVSMIYRGAIDRLSMRTRSRITNYLRGSK